MVVSRLSMDHNPWIFEADRFDCTPSIRDGITRPQETKLRIEGCLIIHNLGIQWDPMMVATGSVFFHRFYMFHSFNSFHVVPMAVTCLFLAGKAEETPKKSNDLVKSARALLSEEEFKHLGPDPKEEILTLERILLQTLRFDLEIEHPYKFLPIYGKQFKVRKGDQEGDAIYKQLLQTAWTFCNDICKTIACLQYEPEIIAIAMIFLTCKTRQFDIYDWEGRRPEHKVWWEAHVENLDTPILESICHLVLDAYQIQGRTINIQ